MNKIPLCLQCEHFQNINDRLISVTDNGHPCLCSDCVKPPKEYTDAYGYKNLVVVGLIVDLVDVKVD